MLSQWTLKERLGFLKLCPGKAGFYPTEIHKVAKKLEKIEIFYSPFHILRKIELGTFTNLIIPTKVLICGYMHSIENYMRKLMGRYLKL